MVMYTLTVEKTLQVGDGEKWTNVYHGDVATALDANDLVDSIAALEQAILKDYVTITRVGIARPGVPGSAVSRNVALAGSVSGDPDLLLPLFNTVYYRLIPTGGRPSPKYLRLPIQEGEVTGGVLETTLTNAISTNYAVPLIALSGHTDEDGQPFSGYGFKPNVQMRQLSWHRRVRPGFHRGWVPD